MERENLGSVTPMARSALTPDIRVAIAAPFLMR
jgi:hypothetical protein